LQTEINQLIDKFTDHLQNELGYSFKTAEKYYYHLRKFFKDTDVYHLDQITSENLNQEFLFKFWDSFESGRPLSNTNRKNYLAALKAFTKFLYEKGFIKENISDTIKLPTPEIVFKEALSEEEEKKLAEYFFTHLDTEVGRRDAALFYFLWSTGCRIDEALKVRCGPEGIINTKNPLARSGDFSLYKGEVYVYIKGKGKRHRMIPVDKTAIGYMNYHLINRSLKSDIIFTNTRNPFNDKKQLSVSGANLRLKVIARETGIQKLLTTHVFRHTFITKMIQKGISTKKIMAMVGIAREETLEWYYRRDKMLTLNFAREDSPLKTIPKSKKQKEFEKFLSEHY